MYSGNIVSTSCTGIDVMTEDGQAMPYSEITLKVFRWPDQEPARELTINCSVSVEELKHRACKVLNVDEDGLELRKYQSKTQSLSLELAEFSSKRIDEVLDHPSIIYLINQNMMARLRKAYEEGWYASTVRERQLCVALYLNDKLALRAGYKIDEDKADTIGCATWKVENLGFVKDKSVSFRFPGKDGKRYEDEVQVNHRVYKLLHEFYSIDEHGKLKWAKDKLFDALNAKDMDEFCKELMDRVTMKEKGLCGLTNLGNTCFLNSDLQCLRFAQPFMEAHLTGTCQSPDADLAKAFGDVLKALWRGTAPSHSPTAFIDAVRAIDSGFADGRQQDSHEFLMAFLNRMHEQLNTAAHLPGQLDEPDNSRCPDDVAARTFWDSHKLANDSIISQNFLGMWRSSLVCPSCGHASRNFETFMDLSLPVPEPERDWRTLLVTALFMDGREEPQHLSVNVPKLGTIGQAYKILARAVALPGHQKAEELLLLAGFVNEVLAKFTDPTARMNSIVEGTRLYLYRYASKACGPASGGIAVTLLHRMRPPSEVLRTPLVLYLSEAEVVSLDLREQWVTGWTSHIWAQQPYVLDDALRAALRPFHRHRSSQESLTDVQDGGELEFATQAASAQDSWAGSGAAMDASTGGEGNGLGKGSPEGAHSSRAGGPGEKEAVEREGQSRGISQPSDMWAAQDASTKQPTQVLWEYRFCTSEGDTEVPDGPAADADELHFAVEWTLEAAAQYNFSALERPAVRESSSGSAQSSSSRRSSSCTLEQCLEAHFKKETVPWACPNSQCESKVEEGIKKIDLWSVPEVATLQLKRFHFTAESHHRIDAIVDFPLELDMGPYIAPEQDVLPPKYDLFAVNKHSGELGGGHYIATCLYQDKWYKFDDSRVHPAEVADTEENHERAYLLFYRRRGPEA